MAALPTLVIVVRTVLKRNKGEILIYFIIYKN